MPDILSKPEGEAIRATIQSLQTAQACALNAAAISIEIVTASDPETRGQTARQFVVFRDRYAVVSKSILATAMLQGGEGAKHLDVVREIGRRFAALPAEEGVVRVEPHVIGSIVAYVRVQGIPAMMQLIGVLRAKQKAHDKAMRQVMRDRIRQLDAMFTEVEEIGQMIHMISLNASVEAARAGGASGRSFKIIADEIRGLARQASDLIETTREGVLPDGVEDRRVG